MKSSAKNQFLIIVFLPFLVYACDGNQKDFAGTYVNHAESEFSIANDTLIVEHSGGNSYLIYRKTGYSLIDENGGIGKQQLEIERWKAVFDEGSQSLTENRKGRVISFDPEKKLLMLENSKYQQIKN